MVITVWQIWEAINKMLFQLQLIDVDSISESIGRHMQKRQIGEVGSNGKDTVEFQPYLIPLLHPNGSLSPVTFWKLNVDACLESCI